MAARFDEEDDGGDRRSLPAANAWTRALKEVRAVYRHADATYAPYSCPASADCCQLAKTRREPWLWEAEWRVLEAGIARLGLDPKPREDGACPLLDAAGKHCRAYADRPLGCRTFFCSRVKGPSRQPFEEMTTLSLRLEHLSVDLDPDAKPRPLLDWFRARWDADDP